MQAAAFNGARTVFMLDSNSNTYLRQYMMLFLEFVCWILDFT